MESPSLLHYDVLERGRNLLAFSHGVDSTALFYLLLDGKIEFDIALVNYGVRAQSDVEERAARALALRHGKKFYLVRAPRWESGFEENARRFRYDFFESLIVKEGYDNLLTAHQLDDRLAWLLMRLRRGAGAAELAGMETLSLRHTPEGREYRLIRPLLEVPRKVLYHYLEERGLRYFEDESNGDGSNERGSLDGFVSMFSTENASGLVRSFRYLDRDRKRIRKYWRVLVREKELRILLLNEEGEAGRAADTTLKELGYLLSGKERERIDRGESLVAGRHWVIESRGPLLYLAPYLPDQEVPRAFRERCRILGIPPKIRPYCFRMDMDLRKLTIRITH